MYINKGEKHLVERQNINMMQLDTSNTAENILFDKLIDLNNLYASFKKCKKQTYWKCSVQRYESNLLFNLLELRNSLINGTYVQKPFVEFELNERGKKRHIKSLHISDRVLQRALCDYILEPSIRKYLIYDNGASIKGKGIDFTKRRLVTHLHKYYSKHGSEGYILLCDFKKYFDSIPHDKLILMFKKYIHDDKVLSLVKYLISTFGNGKGLGIGSQISQIAGISYLIDLDNFIKIVKGCKYYGRYMDDFYIIHEDKNYLKSLLDEIKIVVNNLGLNLNEKKTQIYRIDKGFTFLKLKTHITKTGQVIRIPCRKNIIREKRKLKKLKYKNINFKDIYNSYLSFTGNLKRYNSFFIIKKLNNFFNSLYYKELKINNLSKL